MSVNTTTGSPGGILRPAILSQEAAMSEVLFIALVFAAGIGVGYGLRSHLVVMHREKLRRRM
ncbi:hypothetical protein [Afipia birgiae]|jgi:hypothetical protein|uniref:hypothetical protein n=1 Tax=Afipia birgiae TaxID=151414 RepID=UPI0003701818|nr:hypothetical protein [Afipia birgiae]MBX9819294.1 hypothetical protein [Afipia birgiae]